MTRWDEARQAFAQLLGPRRAGFSAEVLARYETSVDGQTRQVHGVLLPQTIDEVVALVKEAARHGAPLYPVSSGMNWGMGCRLPVRDGAFVVDLRGLRRIVDYDARHGVIVIEAGVTQREVHDFLEAQQAPFYLNVTGSSADSSVLGNTVDRGIAHFGARVKEVVSLEVVLGTGERLRTGGAVFDHSASKNLYPFGIGADLTGLFFQTNLGIVAQLGLKLRRKRGLFASLGISLEPAGKLEALIERLHGLHVEGWLGDNLHFSNRSRQLSVLSPLFAHASGQPADAARRFAGARLSSEWGANVTLTGALPALEQKLAKARAALAGLARTDLAFEADIFRAANAPPTPGEDSRAALDRAWARATLDVFRHGRGVPSDVALASLNFALDGRFTTDVDRGGAGVLFVLPLVPFEGAAVAKAQAILEQVFAAHQFELFVTYNLVENDCFETVANLIFDRSSPEQADRAHRCVAQAQRALFDAGFPPYRAGIQAMSEVVTMAPAHFELLSRLKTVFDPSGILAPGRYNLR